MSRKKGFFGWFGKKEAEQPSPEPVAEEQLSSIEETVESKTAAETSSTPEPIAAPTEEKTTLVDDSPKLDEQPTESVVEAVSETITEVEPETITEPEPEEVIEEPIPEAEIAPVAEVQQAAEPVPAEAPEKKEKVGLFARLKRSLSRTKLTIGSGLFGLFKGKKIDDELFEDLETQLLMADVGIDTTTKIIDSVTESAERRQLKDGEALYDLLKNKMRDILGEVNQPLSIPPEHKGPFVILMVGVNGVGKTTTIGKLAKQFQSQGKSVMLAAGDTFRAAAVEQLQVWGERNDIHVVAQHTGADSASVVFDALESAKAKNTDILIADTAGRLQNKAHLMEELKKIVRVMKKIDADAPHEIMLVIDAATGQNAISQTKLFTEAVGLTGITLTKMDGTAKGGVIFAVADQFKVPIRYIGVGEGIDDLRSFDADDFTEALFSTEE
ncbi:signal recognition particle-docking protein FtsY [Catenovulum maritimum]|uniref:Signal recognition particle receptor FtsY n=1 Tax=Catenovulum maritimum TaxID=1513271 RepID=A0A0J8JHF1_9ALTE|nr:signal recognition particle-docking protein FtsY [Catenovulum maritimum]KMT63856.1 cell division protein FtsY [Catenovulum maritimum]